MLSSLIDRTEEKKKKKRKRKNDEVKIKHGAK
jgi:hypothetical protein